MNLKKRKQISKLKSIIFNSAFKQATEGSIHNTESSIFIKTNGIFKMLQISFKGEPFINNILPDGYSITMNSTKIIILNLANKPLRKSLPLFTYSGNLEISSASIHNLKGEIIVLGNVDEQIKSNVNESKTNLEDDSLLIIDDNIGSYIKRSSGSSKRGINSTIVKGLYKSDNFEDGYSGYYNYDFLNNIYITGKSITKDSKIINRTKKINTSPKQVKALRKIIERHSGVSTQSTNKSSARRSVSRVRSVSTQQKKSFKKKGKY